MYLRVLRNIESVWPGVQVTVYTGKKKTYTTKLLVVSPWKEHTLIKETIHADHRAMLDTNPVFASGKVLEKAAGE